MERLFFLALLLSFLFSCSPRYGIYKAKAYVRESVAGTIPVDQQGRPTTTGLLRDHLIFIETDTAAPRFTGAWADGKPYSVRLVEMTYTGQSIGKTAEGKEVVLAAKPSRKLWQAVLFPPQDLPPANAALQEKIRQNQVVLTGIWKDEEFVFTLNKEEKIQGRPLE